MKYNQTATILNQNHYSGCGFFEPRILWGLRDRCKETSSATHQTVAGQYIKRNKMPAAQNHLLII